LRKSSAARVARDLPRVGCGVPRWDAAQSCERKFKDRGEDWGMSEEIDEHLGKRLRRRRRLLGLTQQQLAEACGVRFQQIQKYECAANRMSAARVWQLAQVLEVPVSYFYEGLGPQRECRSRDGENPREMFTQKETRDLIRAYYSLSERPRRRLLDLAKSLNADIEA
jgi:transcriptional regulator with XRE-family HTH domain